MMKVKNFVKKIKLEYVGYTYRKKYIYGKGERVSILQASFLATAQETHADSLPEKQENLPFQHIA